MRSNRKTVYLSKPSEDRPTRDVISSVVYKPNSREVSHYLTTRGVQLLPDGTIPSWDENAIWWFAV